MLIRIDLSEVELWSKICYVWNDYFSLGLLVKTYHLSFIPMSHSYNSKPINSPSIIWPLPAFIIRYAHMLKNIAIVSLVPSSTTTSSISTIYTYQKAKRVKPLY